MTRFQLLRRWVRFRYEAGGLWSMHVIEPLRSLTWPIRDFHTWRYFRAARLAVEQGRWVIRA